MVIFMASVWKKSKDDDDDDDDDDEKKNSWVKTGKSFKYKKCDLKTRYELQ